MNELSIYESFSNLTTMSKKEILNLAEKQAEYIEEIGDADKFWAFLHKLSTLIDGAKKNITPYAVNQIKEGVSFHGVEMKVKCKGDWDYSNDAEWVRLNQLKKDREDFLKGVKESFDFLNEETGEVVTIFPPIRKWSKDFIEGKF